MTDVASSLLQSPPTPPWGHILGISAFRFSRAANRGSKESVRGVASFEPSQPLYREAAIIILSTVLLGKLKHRAALAYTQGPTAPIDGARVEPRWFALPPLPCSS